ncbi:integrase core domain-containing protein [Couchioplanes caeruleus]|uniref:Integrase-like protein n=1 Tax=Couchioplanes caeruleus TaxID=56438 RepID=A0A3N1GJP7_9ACTN|nr:integrase-like protein [Couchioplanes caeruleus]
MIRARSVATVSESADSRKSASRQDVGAHRFPAATPGRRGRTESANLNGRFRDEFLTCEQFNTLLEAQVLAEDWRIEYNTYRPHGSLDWLTPDALHSRWITNRQPALS